MLGEQHKGLDVKCTMPSCPRPKPAPGGSQRTPLREPSGVPLHNLCLFVSEYNPVCCKVKSRISSPPKNAASTTPSHPLPRLALTYSAQRIPPAPDHVNIRGREQGLTCKRHQESTFRPPDTSTLSPGMNQMCCLR